VAEVEARRRRPRRAGGLRHRADRQLGSRGGLGHPGGFNEPEIAERGDHRAHFLRRRRQPELVLRPLHDPGDVALAVHSARQRVLALVEPEHVVALGRHHVDEAGAVVLDGLGDQVLAKSRPVAAGVRGAGPGAGRRARRLHHPPFRSSVSTSLATAFSVSNTPMPLGATASKLGTLVGLSVSSSSLIWIALGRSRLLYWTTYGSLSRS